MFRPKLQRPAMAGKFGMGFPRPNGPTFNGAAPMRPVGQQMASAQAGDVLNSGLKPPSQNQDMSTFGQGLLRGRQQGLPIGDAINSRGVDQWSPSGVGPKPKMLSPGLVAGGGYGLPAPNGGRPRYVEGATITHEGGGTSRVTRTPSGGLALIRQSGGNTPEQVAMDEAGNRERRQQSAAKDKTERILRNARRYGLSDDLPAVAQAMISQGGANAMQQKGNALAAGVPPTMTPREQHLHDAELDTRTAILEGIKDPMKRMEQVNAWKLADAASAQKPPIKGRKGLPSPPQEIPANTSLLPSLKQQYKAYVDNHAKNPPKFSGHGSRGPKSFKDWLGDFAA